MKRNILLTSLLLLSTHFIFAQSADYKVVFDITNSSSENQRAVIREAGLIKQAHPDAMLEIVAYGEGLNLMLKDKSEQAPDIEKLAQQGIRFKVCAMTMKRKQVDPSRLITGVDVVPDGIYEIISKQHEGWGYIKVAH